MKWSWNGHQLRTSTRNVTSKGKEEETTQNLWGQDTGAGLKRLMPVMGSEDASQRRKDRNDSPETDGI
ncbi:hypothetical protein ACOMHN_015014 [Nucella lapillus]